MFRAYEVTASAIELEDAFLECRIPNNDATYDPTCMT